MTDHKHCWHYEGGYTNGLSLAGVDTFCCCHCGQHWKRDWKSLPDPKHGSYAQSHIKVYNQPEAE